jgi:L-asparaginase
MAVDQALGALVRPVVVLGAGGTISMSGERATPALDAQALIGSVGALAAVPRLSAETVLALPGAHVSLGDALALGRRAADVAAAGSGVVITTGTDTLEELAVLCALLHAGQAPIVLTGANRPASAAGADGPANLLDAVAVAGAAQSTGLGACVCFAGELHAAMTVRKVDSTGPAAFGSPSAGPLGRVVEGRLWLHARPVPAPAIVPSQLGHRVEIVTATLGDGGGLLAHVIDEADGVVLVAFGAGHLSLPLLRVLQSARIPVLVTTRPERSSMLFSTYGFEGAEADLRQTGAVCVPFLSPQAARIALLCCLGAGLDRPAISLALGAYDAW